MTYRIYRYQNLIVPTANYIGNTCKKYQSDRAGKDGNNYIRCCPKFGSAITTYGWPNFEYSVLEDGLTKEEAYEREQYWIEYFDSVNQGYNISIGGAGKTGVSNQYSEESKNKISEIHKNHSVSEETKRIVSEKLKNRMDLSKRVLQFTMDGQFKAEYPSINEASRQTEVNRKSIGFCCQGWYKSAGNYIWKFA